MPGQTLVDERVIGIQQIEYTGVVADDAPEEQFRLALHGLPKIIVEIGERLKIGLNVLQVPQIKPLIGEVRNQSLRALSPPASAGPAD